MSALEQIIIEKLRKLHEVRQQEILEHIQDIEKKEAFDFDAWMRDVDQFRVELRAEYGENHVFGALDLLDELREQRDNGIQCSASAKY